MKIQLIAIILLICVLLVLLPTVMSVASGLCPSPRTVNAAQLDITDGSGRHYLINAVEQGLAASTGNVAGLRYKGNPARWEVGGVRVDPDWRWAYHITYWTDDWKVAGETWFAALPGHDDVYFYFTMPAGEPDHPNCGYGSIARMTVDELLKARK